MLGKSRSLSRQFAAPIETVGRRESALHRSDSALPLAFPGAFISRLTLLSAPRYGSRAPLSERPTGEMSRFRR